MVDQVQNAMSSVEQYRMAKNIIDMWESYRMIVMYVFAALLVLTIVLYVMKSCWKKWILFFTILTGLTIVALEGFKMYVEYKKKEVITSALATPLEAVEKTAGNAVEGVMGMVK